MCRTIMETTSNPVYLRPGSKPRWNMLHVSAEDRATREHSVQKQSRKQKRSQKAKHAALVIEASGSLGFFKQEKQKSRHRAAEAYQRPTGAMAPENTTQYLMRNVYEDEKIDETQIIVPPETSTVMYSESLSPKSVSAALDSYYDGILAFQLRDFDELFGLTWQPE